MNKEIIQTNDLQKNKVYNGNEKLSPLVTQITWTNHLLILSSAKSEEEREYYMLQAINEKYSKRELNRQIESGLYE